MPPWHLPCSEQSPLLRMKNQTVDQVWWYMSLTLGLERQDLCEFSVGSEGLPSLLDTTHSCHTNYQPTIGDF